MRSDVVQRPAPGLSRIKQPTAMSAIIPAPLVASKFSQNRRANHTRCQQFLRPSKLRISPPIIRHAKNRPHSFRSAQPSPAPQPHSSPSASRRAHASQPAAPESSAACAEKPESPRKLRPPPNPPEPRPAKPSSNVTLRSLRRIARNQSVQPAARLRLNRRNHAASRNIADSDQDPIKHE